MECIIMLLAYIVALSCEDWANSSLTQLGEENPGYTLKQLHAAKERMKSRVEICVRFLKVTIVYLLVDVTMFEFKLTTWSVLLIIAPLIEEYLLETKINAPEKVENES